MNWPQVIIAWLAYWPLVVFLGWAVPKIEHWKQKRGRWLWP